MDTKKITPASAASAASAELDHSLPHRFRQRAFRRYEGIIATIVNRFPLPVVVPATTLGFSPTTVACRLRDAMRSLLDNHWPTTQVDIARFTEIHDQVVVRERNGNVVAGGRDETTTLNNPGRTLAYLPSEEGSNVFDFSWNQVCAVCQLAAARLLTRSIIVRGITPAEQAELETRFDVAITAQPDGGFEIF